MREELRCDVLRAEALLEVRERLVAPDLLDAVRDLVLAVFDRLDAALPRLPELDLEPADREFFLFPVLRPDLDGISDFLPLLVAMVDALQQDATINRAAQFIHQTATTPPCAPQPLAQAQSATKAQSTPAPSMLVLVPGAACPPGNRGLAARSS